MDEKEFYENCEFDIRIYKTKDMKCSKQIISGDNKLCILTGISSFLQSCLESNVMTTDELDEIIKMIKEVRKSGARNTVIYSNLNE